MTAILQRYRRRLSRENIYAAEAGAMGNTEIPCGEELVRWLNAHGIRNNQIAVAADLRPQTTEAFIKGKTDGSTRDTVWAVLDAINKRLEPSGKYVEYRRGRDKDYFVVKEKPNPSAVVDEDGVNWIRLVSELQLATEEQDPAEKKRLIDLILFLATAQEDQRRAAEAVVEGLKALTEKGTQGRG